MDNLFSDFIVKSGKLRIGSLYNPHFKQEAIRED